MQSYPKTILTIPQQAQAIIDAGMQVSDHHLLLDALTSIGYYRLRGYCFPFYNNITKTYLPDTTFDNIIQTYRFDRELTQLIFSFLSKIEVALRARLSNALLVYNDALVLEDSSKFKDKEIFWRNMGTIASEIARSSDIFIKHHFNNHNGEIPVWAAVEIMSFGTLSKVIKNLLTGPNSAFDVLAAQYTYQTINGQMAKPSMRAFSSWTHSLVILRNICAHNSRLYNRIINVRPIILSSDRISAPSPYPKIYQLILTMKYLSPSVTTWHSFAASYQELITKFSTTINIAALGMPPDWTKHL